VENDWETWELLLDSCKNIECQWRRNKTTSLWVTCTLLWSELVSTVRSTDRDSQRVATCTSSEINNLLWLCIVRNLSYNVILNTSKYTELSLNCYVELVSILNNLLCQSNILLIWKRRTVDHYRRETEVYTALASLEAITMIKVKCNLWMVATQLLSILYCPLCEVTEKSLISILASTLRYLKDNW